MPDSDCLFCRIARGELPSEQVYADDEVLAFRDIQPRAPIHLLVIPRRHFASAHDLTDADGELVGHLFSVMRRLADEAGVRDGYRIVTNVGRDAGLSVAHLHFHLLAGRQMGWPPG